MAFVDPDAALNRQIDRLFSSGELNHGNADTAPRCGYNDIALADRMRRSGGNLFRRMPLCKDHELDITYFNTDDFGIGLAKIFATNNQFSSRWTFFRRDSGHFGGERHFFYG